MEYQSLNTPQPLYSNDTSPTSPYNAGQSAIERLQNLAEQRASYNAIMMRKAEDRYKAYMEEMQRRYEASQRKTPWWKKMIGGGIGGALTGGMIGMFTGGPLGAVIGAGAGLTGGATMGALGAGGESGSGGMMPILGQAGMMGAMYGARGAYSPMQFGGVAGGGGMSPGTAPGLLSAGKIAPPSGIAPMYSPGMPGMQPDMPWYTTRSVSDFYSA